MDLKVLVTHTLVSYVYISNPLISDFQRRIWNLIRLWGFCLNRRKKARRLLALEGTNGKLCLDEFLMLMAQIQKTFDHSLMHFLTIF